MVLLPLLRIIWQAVRHVVDKAEGKFRRWTKPATYTLIEATAADLIRTRPELVAENAFLRQQLIVLQRQVKHPTLTPLNRGLLVVLASRVAHWKHALLIVKPDTLLKWHRQGFKLFWRRKSQGPARQPRIDEATIALIKRMAVENRRWGTQRIRGELLKLGLQVNRGTIRRYMAQTSGNCVQTQHYLNLVRDTYGLFITASFKASLEQIKRQLGDVLRTIIKCQAGARLTALFM